MLQEGRSPGASLAEPVRPKPTCQPTKASLCLARVLGAKFLEVSKSSKSSVEFQAKQEQAQSNDQQPSGLVLQRILSPSLGLRKRRAWRSETMQKRLPGYGTIIEFCCRETSNMGIVSKTLGLNCARLTKSFGNMSKPEIEKQLNEVIDAGDGADLWGSLPYTPWTKLQYLNCKRLCSSPMRYLRKCTDILRVRSLCGRKFDRCFWLLPN